MVTFLEFINILITSATTENLFELKEKLEKELKDRGELE